MKPGKKLNLFFAACAAVVLMNSSAPACTGITVKAKDGAVIHARTLEFGKDLHSRVLMVPQGYALTSSAPGGKTGLAWKAAYAVLGLDFLGKTAIADGMNEKGLAAGLFYLPSFAQYQKVTPADQDKSLAPWDVTMWVLTSFASVDEVRAALPMADGQLAARQAFQLLDSFYITKGMARSIEEGKTSYDYTQWMDACDLKNLRFYFATYDNLVPKMVDFKKLNMQGNKLLHMPITGGPFYEDVTDLVK
ncbi:linear amide C-N hydrolase, choloylglycine hydrolase family protein [delta proteobacterium NaphS2]|nr:linear amide C-N hydrolase, choloylglycine hydrolase family protein [delta proteobacterium NaphS2]